MARNFTHCGGHLDPDTSMLTADVLIHSDLRKTSDGVLTLKDAISCVPCLGIMSDEDFLPLAVFRSLRTQPN